MQETSNLEEESQGKVPLGAAKPDRLRFSLQEQGGDVLSLALERSLKQCKHAFTLRSPKAHTPGRPFASSLPSNLRID